MAQNRYTRITPVQDTASPFMLPTQFLAAALEKGQQVWDQGEAKYNELSSVTADALPGQRTRADELLGEYNQRVEKVVDLYEGNYMKANSELKQLERDWKKLSGKGGEIGSIESNYKNFAAYREEQKKRIGAKDNGITAQQYNTGLNYMLEEFNKQPQQDPETGQFKSIQLDGIAKYVNGSEKARTIAKEMVPKVLSLSKIERSPDGLYWMTRDGQRTVLPKDTIQKVVSAELMKDPELLNFLSQSYLHATGENPTEDQLRGIINSHAAAAAVMYEQDETDLKYSVDEDAFALASRKGAIARANIKYKHGLENPAQNNLNTRYMNYTNTGANKKPLSTGFYTGELQGVNPGSKLGIFSGLKTLATGKGYDGNTLSEVGAFLKDLFVSGSGGAGYLPQPGTEMESIDNSDNGKKLYQEYKKTGRIEGMQNDVLPTIFRTMELNGHTPDKFSSNEEYNKKIVEYSESLAGNINVGSTLVTGYNPKMIEDKTDALVRSGAIKNYALGFVGEDGQVHTTESTGLTPSEFAKQVGGIEMGELMNMGVVEGDVTPGAGVPSGSIMNVRDPKGKVSVPGQFIIMDHNEADNGAWAWATNRDKVRNGDMDKVNITNPGFPEEYGRELTLNGAWTSQWDPNLGMYRPMRDEWFENEKGQRLDDPRIFSVPLTPEQATTISRLRVANNKNTFDLTKDMKYGDK